MDMEASKEGIDRIGKKEKAKDSRGELILTGIRSLDQKLGMELSSRRGIPEGSLILVSYPSDTVIPTLFVQRILLNWAQKKGENVIFYVHSSRPYDHVLRSFQAYEWDVTPYENKNWYFENMFDLSSSTMTSALKLGKIEVRRKTYVKRIIEKMLHVKDTQNKQCFSVFDDLLWMKEDRLDEDSNALITFIKDAIMSFARIGGVHFFLVPQGVLDPVAERIIMNASQGIFYFSRNTVGSRIKDNFAITKLMGVAYISETLEVSPSEAEGFKIESTAKI
ncbi:MAG: RAD55 family ATPase [Candidatus Heimdallarchaeaceae archaeon]